MEVTANYGLFGHLVGNRPINKKHVEDLIASIEENGWLHQPITVNEKFEIIDGQHRFEALKALKQPIEYVVVDDANGKTCQALNTNQKNWNIIDYVKFFADNGNDNYSWLIHLVRQYKSLGATAVMSAAANALTNSGGAYASKLKSGDFSVAKHERFEIENELFYMSQLVDIQKMLGGRAVIFWGAVDYIYKFDGTDRDRLMETLKTNQYKLISCGTVTEYIKQIEGLYNKALVAKNRINPSLKYATEVSRNR